MQKKKNRSRAGFSLIELLIVIAIILIILGIALPKLQKARTFSQEMAAVGTIRTLHTAETQYYSQFGKYASSLNEMGPPTSGSPNASAADLIPKDLSLGEKGGYKYTISVTPTGYAINANPSAFGNTGTRTFYSDQSMAVHENYGQEPASANSPEMK